MMETDTNDGELKTSKYNSAIAQLYRIDELWKDSHRHSRSGELIKWNWDLDRVWCELAADASKEQKEKFLSFIKKIRILRENREGLYSVLLEKEIFLRELQNSQGKGTAYADEFEDDFE